MDWTVHPQPISKPSTADSITNLIQQVFMFSNAKRGQLSHGPALTIKKLTYLTGFTRHYI